MPVFYLKKQKNEFLATVSGNLKHHLEQIGLKAVTKFFIAIADKIELLKNLDQNVRKLHKIVFFEHLLRAKICNLCTYNILKLIRGLCLKKKTSFIWFCSIGFAHLFVLCIFFTLIVGTL